MKITIITKECKTKDKDAPAKANLCFRLRDKDVDLKARSHISPINYDSFKSIYDLVFALSFLIISYLQVLSSKLIKSNHCCFSIYSFHVFFCVK